MLALESFQDADRAIRIDHQFALRARQCHTELSRRRIVEREDERRRAGRHIDPSRHEIVQGDQAVARLPQPAEILPEMLRRPSPARLRTIDLVVLENRNGTKFIPWGFGLWALGFGLWASGAGLRAFAVDGLAPRGAALDSGRRGSSPARRRLGRRAAGDSEREQGERHAQQPRRAGRHGRRPKVWQGGHDAVELNTIPRPSANRITISAPRPQTASARPVLR